MVKIGGVEYLTSKEVAQRYGFSKSWFEKRRLKRLEPKFARFDERGKVYYPLKETDMYFQNKFKIEE